MSIPSGAYFSTSTGYIFHWNRTANSVTIVGNTGLALTDIAFHPDGTLYAITATALYRINTETKAAVHIAPLTGTLFSGDNQPRKAAGLGIDPASGIALITMADNFVIAEVNLASGALRNVGTMPSFGTGDIVFSDGFAYASTDYTIYALGRGTVTNRFMEFSSSFVGTQMSGLTVSPFKVASGVNGLIGAESGTVYDLSVPGVPYAGSIGSFNVWPGFISGAATLSVSSANLDIPGSAATTTTLSPETPATSVIDFAGDEDWFRVNLVAGRTYTFTQDAVSGSSLDSYLRLLSGSGVELASNDDGGPGINSLITFTATHTGIHYLSAQGFGTSTGGYRVTIALPFGLGTNGADTLTGSANADTLQGLDGNDLISGLDGNDLLEGGAGNDFLLGGAGNDTLRAGQGNDTIWAGAGNDRIEAQEGTNEVWAGTGNDTLIGGTGNDILGGGADDDLIDARAGGQNQLWGGSGADTLWSAANGDVAGGGWGDDFVHGGAGADTLMGGLGNDTVQGADGGDRLFLGMGNDLGYGGAGADTLVGGPGFDRLWGGTGADRFEFWRGYGFNRIEDFNRSEGDVLALGRGMWTGTHGVLGAAQVVQTFGRVNSTGDAVLDFTAAGTAVVIVGAGTLDGLSGSILIL